MLNISLFIYGLRIIGGIFILCLNTSSVEEILTGTPYLFLEIINLIYDIGIIILFILTYYYFFAIGYFFEIFGIIKYCNIRNKFYNRNNNNSAIYKKIKKDYLELFI